MGNTQVENNQNKKRKPRYNPPPPGKPQTQGDKPDPRNSKIVQNHFQLTPEGQQTYQKIKHNISFLPSTIYQLYDPSTTYQGNFENRLPHGYGVAYFQNQSFYAGQFFEGNADSDIGIFISPDGSLYQGGFRNSFFNGYGGKQDYRKKIKYVGEWKEGKPHGFGQEIIEKNKILLNSSKGLMQINDDEDFGEILMYTGQFKEGKKQGYGKLKTTTGCFEGNFKKGYLNNIGVFTWDDQIKVYIGNFNETKPNGEGKIYYEKKIEHVEWKNKRKLVVTSEDYEYSYMEVKKVKQRHAKSIQNSKKLWEQELEMLEQAKQNSQQENEERQMEGNNKVEDKMKVSDLQRPPQLGRLKLSKSNQQQTLRIS